MKIKKPNILIVMADQLTPYFSGVYGHPLVKTPHMSALAARGARFDAMYSNSPLCAPARFAFMSGQLITRFGGYDNASEFPASIPTFAHYLRAMGYATCLSGKMHFIGPDQLHGFEERLTTDLAPADFAWTADWTNPYERNAKWWHNLDAVLEAGVVTTTHQIDYDEEVIYKARRKLLDFARVEDRPFCLVASFIHPHDPYATRPEWWNTYDHSQIDMPRYPSIGEAPDPFSKRIYDGLAAKETPPSEEQVRNARHAYYGNVSYFDSQVGKLCATLRDIGALDDTIIIVTGDHGDMLGERGLWYKMHFYEHSARVPLLISGPGIKHCVINSPCSLVDILPTLVDAASRDGAAAPEWAAPIDGRSLLPMAETGEEDDGAAFGEYCAEMTASPVFMIRRGKFKYIACTDDPPMLFDLDTDPDERDNLATQAQFTDLSREFSMEVRDKWNSDAIRQEVIAQQRQRVLVDRARSIGKATHWDFNPPYDAHDQYVRNHKDWTIVHKESRFPPLD